MSGASLSDGFLQRHHLRADGDAVIEIDDVLVDEADAHEKPPPHRRVAAFRVDHFPS
jgi:hypothetical protein